MEKEQKAFLNVSYEREGFHNYMVLQPNQKITEFEISMINRQQTCRLLPLSFQKESLYYTVDGLQLLEEQMKHITFSFSQFHALLESLIQTLKELEKYMLLADSIVLHPDILYMDADKSCLYLCYVPGYKGNIQKEFGSFMEFLMNRVNHLDDNLIVLIYGVYHITKEENYSLEKVEGFLQQKRHLIRNEETLDEYHTSQNREFGNIEQVYNIEQVQNSKLMQSTKQVQNTKQVQSTKQVQNSKQVQSSKHVQNTKQMQNGDNYTTVAGKENNEVCEMEQSTPNSRILRYQMGKWRQQRVVYGMISSITFILSLYLCEKIWILGNVASKNLLYACIIVLLGAVGSFIYATVKIKDFKKHIINIENNTFS